MLSLSSCLPRFFTPGRRPSGRASGASAASSAGPGKPAPRARPAGTPLQATGGKHDAPEPEQHVDKRSGDPEHGGLTTGEKAAITREVHGEGHVHFTEEHPELKKAAEAYRKEVVKDEKHGIQHGSGGHSSTQTQAAAAQRTTAGERDAKEGSKEGSGGKASRHAAELSPGEKAAISRYLHEGRDVRGLPFVRAHLEKVAAVEAYAKELKGKAKK